MPMKIFNFITRDSVNLSGACQISVNPRSTPDTSNRFNARNAHHIPIANQVRKTEL